MNKIRTACALLLILALSACSSGGGGGGGASFLSQAPGADGGPLKASTITGFQAAIEELENDDSLALATTVAAQATLNGYIGISDITVADEENNETAFGHLTIEADFEASTVTTRATDFRTFDTSNPDNPVALNRDDSIAGGELAGSGIITNALGDDGVNIVSMESTLNGDLTNVGGDNVRVRTNLSGTFYDAEGRLIVLGFAFGSAVSGGETIGLGGLFAASEARPSGEPDASTSDSGGGGDFVVPAVLSEASGAGGGTIQARTLANVVAAVNEVETAIDDGSLTAPNDFPTIGSSATLKGYVGIGVTKIGTLAFGHLTIAATFGAGMSATVVTTATDFKDFDVSDFDSPDATASGISGGTLRGTGMIDGTTITSTLVGTLMTDDGRGDIDIVSRFVDGKVYEDGEGRLVVHGGVEGTATQLDNPDNFYDMGGRFVASEAGE